MKQEQIDRINELYHKSQAVGLTDAEKEEQAALLSLIHISEPTRRS